MIPRNFFHIDYAPIFVPAILSLIGTLFFLGAERAELIVLLSDRWSLHYLLATPFMHAGFLHCLLNMMALHYLGGGMLLPLLGRRRFTVLLVLGALFGHVLNNLMSPVPAIGFSAAIMAVVACGLYPYSRAGMKLLLIHDLFRLPPFQYRYIVAFIVLLDIVGIIFGWHFFAHWAHLGGFATGLAGGYLVFRRRPF